MYIKKVKKMMFRNCLLPGNLYKYFCSFSADIVGPSALSLNNLKLLWKPKQWKTILYDKN